MKKQVLAILLVALFAGGCAGMTRVSRFVATKETSKIAAKPQISPVVGEKFTFRATWKGITVARATVTVEELMPFKNYEVYKIVVRAKTTPFLSKLFKVNDIFTSYVDKETLVSRYYEANISEGKYRRHLVVDYDFEKKIGIYTNRQDGSVKTAPIKDNVRDPISATYYFRTLPIKSGDNMKIDINLGENNYEIFANVKKRVNVRIPRLGSFDAFFLKPYIKLKGKLQERGKAWGYISSDKRRLPLYVVVKVLEIPFIGNVIATLEKIENISPSKN